MRVSLAFVTLAVLAVAAACGGDDHGAHDSDAGYNCALDERGETFVAGMSKTGANGYAFALDDAVPSPPAKTDNVWTVAVTEPGGAAATSVGMTAVPFMPDHGHGTPIGAVATAVGDGSFTIEPINLWMPGLWEIRLAATDGDTALDQVVFRFCVDG
jgi:hypothetical protein